MLVLSTQQLLVTSTTAEQIGNKIEITRGADEAMKLALKLHNVTFTKKQDRKLAHKIDLYMFLSMCVLYTV